MKQSLSFSIICGLVLVFVNSGLCNSRSDANTHATTSIEGWTETSNRQPGDTMHYPDVDSVLNEAQENLGVTAVAPVTIQKLEAKIVSCPHSKFLDLLYYYTGLNAQLLGDNQKAIISYKAALRFNPQLGKQTAILAYLRIARTNHFKNSANLVLLVLLISIIIAAAWRLFLADAVSVRWSSLFTVYGITLIIWIALILIVPLLLGGFKTGLDDFPKPTLSNFHIGQFGDTPLKMLLWYGCAAILSSLPVIAATSLIKRGFLQQTIMIAGIIIVLGCTMGIYWVRNIYATAQFNPLQKRYIFMVKSIDSMTDVPGEMLPLYEKDFARRVLEAQKKAGK